MSEICFDGSPLIPRRSTLFPTVTEPVCLSLRGKRARGIGRHRFACDYPTVRTVWSARKAVIPQKCVTYCWRMTCICDSNQLLSASKSLLSEK